MREVLIDYQVHALYPVEIARARGIAYETIRHWIYGRRRNVPVDHYETLPDQPAPIPLPPLSPAAFKTANERGYRGDGDDRGQEIANEEKYHGRSTT